MFKKNILKDYLSEKELDEISSVIGEIEKKTSGELKLCIKRKRGYLEDDYTSRELALNEFFNLKIHETADKTGILFFLIMEERKFEIIADEGINSKVSQNDWDELAEEMKTKFSENQYSEGLINSIGKAGEILIREFPVKDGDVNELSDKVVVK